MERASAMIFSMFVFRKNADMDAKAQAIIRQQLEIAG